MKKQKVASGSGNHPAVVAFREKLASIDHGIAADAAELDKKLTAYLGDLKTPVPPTGLQKRSG